MDKCKEVETTLVQGEKLRNEYERNNVDVTLL